MSALDDRAIDLCADYRHEGSAAFVIRTMENGDTRIIGLSLPPSLVAQMLRTAADIYDQSMSEETVN